MKIRDYTVETEKRVAFIRQVLAQSGATGIVYGNSGGKDCTLVGILCKMACENTVGIVMPCQSKRNYESDAQDALLVAKQYNIEIRTVDLSDAKAAMESALSAACAPTPAALSNIAPRLRMITLYTIAQTENRLVAGTGNRSEAYMGYFTKWGDGAYDFNPIADLTVTEVYAFLRYLQVHENIITKKPSAGLFEGQTDEDDMGITYDRIDEFLFTGNATPEDLDIINRYHGRSEHKRKLPLKYE